MFKRTTILLAVISIFIACDNPSEKKEKLNYPETKKVDQSDDYFGTKVDDPYRWLENDTSKATEAWVKAENEVTFDYLNKIPYKAKIAERLKELLNYARVGAPRKVGDFYFVTKNDGLQNQSVVYFKEGKDGEEKIFLDPNTMSSDGTVAASLGSASKDDKYVAININRAGSDWSEIVIREVATNKQLDDKVEFVKFSGASWYKDGFFYSRFPTSGGSGLSNKNEFHSVYYHKLGTDQKEDVLVYKNNENALLYHNISVTEDEDYFVLYAFQGTQGVEIKTRPASDDLSVPFNEMINGFDNESYVVKYYNGRFLIRTNIDAPNYRLISIDPKNVDKENWEELIAEKESVFEGASTGAGKLFAHYLENAQTKIYQSNIDEIKLLEVKLPAPGTANGFGGKMKDETLFYSFTSFTYPGTIFEYDPETKESELYFQPELKFIPADYESKQVWYKSKDGTEVSMFIVHKKGLKLDGTNPTYLYAYGGFNINLTPSFSTTNIVLLENGGIYAMPNLRGGGEYGEKWHEAGMLMEKQNVFDDFIAAAEYLISEKYTSKDKLAIAGGSNGGLLVGACLTQRPELFKVTFPAVGVLDMLRYHKFTVGWGWVPEYGSSEQSKEMFDYLHAYSPLHNVKQGVEYPATMITTADHDDRVVPAHSFKFAATLQAKSGGTNPLLIRIEEKAGHGAGTPISKIIEQKADIWSFMFWEMGYKEL